MRGADPGYDPVIPPAEPLISRHPESCTQCWACIRQCPARALTLVDGVSHVSDERCVGCGQCVTECGNTGHSIRDDLPFLDALICGELPVIALLASEYVAAMHPLATEDLEQALIARGFAAVETTLLGEEIVAAAYQQVHTRTEIGPPRLRSTCPVAVEWVRRFHPHLTGALVSVVPPYIAQARIVRALNAVPVRVAYVSPCWARKDEALRPEFSGEVDVAIGFDELRVWLEREPESATTSSTNRPRVAKRLSVTDGFPRLTLSERDLTDRDVVAVRGLDEIDRLLSAIARGETAPAVVDMLSCEGCLDGPCVGSDKSVFAKRNIVIAERDREAPPSIDSRSLLSALPSIDLTRAFVPAPVPGREPTEAEIDAVLAAGEFAARDEALDCGVCGYRTCVEHAAAIFVGNSSWELCLPLQRKVLERERERFESVSRMDSLTGLLNRRAFDERIAEEVARAQRYAEPLSIVMVDLDGFKAVNDRHGHVAGDSLLRAVGVLLRSELRETDVAARFGGDEFVLILPETAKTEAWAVAEKVRSSLAMLSVMVGAERVGTRGSFGVAGHVAGGTTEGLVHAADSAMYRAKRSGRDRVEIAPG